MTTNKSVKVWDIFVRAFHWLLVAAIGFCWFSGKQGGNWMEWHMYSGYSIIVLIVLRIIWGFVGGRYARFSAFIYSPKTTFQYAVSLFKGQEKHYLSHNPLGAIGVFLLLGLCLAQAGTGLFATDDIMTDGPLMSWVSYDLSLQLTKLHKLIFNGLLGVIGLHIAAVLFHQFFRKERLLQGMITGKK